MLEVGPGTGYYSLEVARWLAPGGTLDILDLQQEMLEHTWAALAGITPGRGDAQALPYPDAAFDAAYTIVTLGEVPDQDAALRELAGVLKPGGRLVVGELCGDPHWVPFRGLTDRAGAASLSYERRAGGRFGYYARFRAAAVPEHGDDRLQTSSGWGSEQQAGR